MLTYTFSRREKAMIFGFAIFLVFIAWFWFVLQGTTNQMNALDGEISAVESEITIAQARITQMNNMSSVVEQRKAAGAKKTVMPTYDNLQPLMTQLNGTMASADSFTLTFDELNQENTDYVRRGVRIDYTCGTYAKAESIVNGLAGGKYPCSVDSVAINDATALSKNATNSGIGWTNANNAKVSASVHVTFFEQYPEDAASTASTAGGRAASAGAAAGSTAGAAA